MAKELTSEKEANRRRKPAAQEAARHTAGPGLSGLAALQQQAGNRAVQRLLAQRSGAGPTELDDETATRINRERSGGQPLAAEISAQAGVALGHDFSSVRVHTSPEADSLNRQLEAKAFTTGQDVFFREGAYEPHSSAGQELLTHELAHVVQQSAGPVAGTGRMAVNPPGDVYEQEADGVARALAGAGSVQRVEIPEEEEKIQTQAEEEEEETQVP